MILDTPRLSLRPFQSGDEADVASYATRAEFWRHLPLDEQTVESAHAFVEARVAGGQPDALSNWHFAAFLKAEGRVVGGFRIGVRDKAHAQGDLGWGLDPAYWGRGLASEGAEALLAFGFDWLGLERIWATADVANERSWAVMERMGMRREGVMLHHRLVRGEWRDNVLYATTAGEFAERRRLRAAA